MNCKTVQTSLSAHLDGRLPEAEGREVSLHLSKCSHCELQFDQMMYLRKAVASLPMAAPPPELTVRLRVMASRERARVLARRHPLGFAAAKIELWIENMMRPLALPFAGGIVAAMLLFSMLVPTFTPRTRAGADVPVGLFTEPAVKLQTPFGFGDAEIGVEVLVDGHGRMIDYTITQGEDLVKDPELRRRIENNLLFTTFTPATAFGQPTPGKIYLYFRSSEIDVRS